MNPNASSYPTSKKGGRTWVPSSDRGGQVIPATSITDPYVKPNRLAYMVGSHSPYVNSSPEGTFSNLGGSYLDLGLVPAMGSGMSMWVVRRVDPLDVLDHPNRLKDMARRGFEILRQDVATSHPEARQLC